VVLGPRGCTRAHAVAYLIAYPDEQRRTTLLALTGHTYLRHASIVAVVAAAAALTLSVARGLRNEKTERWWGAIPRISALQIGAFVSVEMLERVAVGLRPTSGLGRIAVIGVAVQFSMGVIVATVLALARRAGRTIADIAERELRPARRSIRTFVAADASLRFVPLFALAESTRAPPHLLGTA
jgi:hypothetical protein